MEILITPLIIIGIILLVIAIIIFAVKRKLNNLTRRYLGKNLSQTADMLSKGLKGETTLPKPISNLTAVYKPQIERDFPSISYQRMEAMAQGGLINTLNAIEAEDFSSIPDAAPSLLSQVEGIIGDNRSKNIKVRYDDVKIHKTAVSRYKSTKQYAEAVFEISCQALSYEESAEDGKLLCGSKTEPQQFAFKVKLSYNQANYDEGTNSAYSHNCPNCGAPVSVIGGNAVCRFCGSGVQAVEERIWQINSVELLK